MNSHNCPFISIVIESMNSLSPRDKALAASAHLAYVAPMLSDVTPTPTPETPVEPATEPQGSPLTEAEQDVYDFLRLQSVTEDGQIIPFKGQEIADAVGRAYNYIKSVLAPAGELRSRGLIEHKNGVGYWFAG